MAEHGRLKAFLARFLAVAILAFGLGVGPAVPAWAQAAATPSPFTVRDVAVDQTAANAGAAREAAILDGQRQALRRLFERLVPRSDLAKAPRVPDARLTDLVENFEVQSERSSAVRYLATLTVRFRAAAIRGLLREANLAFAETYAKPMLVLPLLRQAGVVLLWDEPNPWRVAWANLPPTDGLVQLYYPRGDLSDIADISAEQAARGDEARVTAISSRYGASGALVALASIEPGPNATELLQVSLSRFGAAASDLTVVESFTSQQGEDTAALMTRAAAQIVRSVEERWKADVLQRFGQEAKLMATVPLTDVADWVAVRNKLGDVAAVRRIDLIAMTRNVAVVEIQYGGDEQSLKLALAQKDLSLDEVGGTVWELKLQRQAGAGAPAPKP